MLRDGARASRAASPPPSPPSSSSKSRPPRCRGVPPSLLPFLSGFALCAFCCAVLALSLQAPARRGGVAAATAGGAGLSAAAASMVQVQEFTHVCREAAYQCLGIARGRAAAECALPRGYRPPGASVAAVEADEFAAAAALAATQALRRATFWADQFAEPGGAARIDGWLEPGDAAVTSALLLLQERELGTRGHFAEIGVHHGKYLIWLALHARAGERAVGMDLFEAGQGENLDHSGKGDAHMLLENAARYATTLEPLAVNSLRLPLCFFHEQRLQGVRFFSVDGGHYTDHAYEDCWSAWSALAVGGIIAVDDFLHGTAVMQGTLRFLAANADARAFVVGPNKLYICHRDFFDVYFESMAAAFPRHGDGFFGASHQVVLMPTTALTLHGWLLPAVLEPGRDVYACDRLSKPYTTPTYP